MKLSTKLKEQLGTFGLVFSLIFVRFCCFGFEYYYQLDDYIQHHNFAARSEGLWNVIESLGLLGARPLAGIADVFFWSRFFSVMIVGVLLISIMYAASACLLRAVWRRHFGTGWVFLIIYSILPLAIEGTYWMSASTRIVCGMFFASLALWFFDTWCESGGVKNLICYAVFQLISYGFYEQVLVFSITSVFLVAILRFKKDNYRIWWAFLSLSNAAIYFGFTHIFSNSGVYSQRTGIILPKAGYYFDTFLPNILGQFKDAFLEGGFYTLAKGFKRGFLLIFSEKMWLYTLVIAALLALLFVFVRKNTVEAKNHHTVKAIIVGFLLALAPISMFFVVEEGWFSLRGTVTSLCGIALIADSLCGLIFRKTKNSAVWMSGLVTLMAFTCCIASVSEIYDYRATTENDTKIVTAVTQQLKNDGYIGNKIRIGVLGVEASYLEDQNYYYHEHIHGVTESGWAMSGMAETLTGQKVDVTPIPANPAYRAWNRPTMLPETFDVLYYYDDSSETLTKITAELRDDGVYEIFGESGEYIGYIREENSIGYFEKSE